MKLASIIAVCALLAAVAMGHVAGKDAGVPDVVDSSNIAAVFAAADVASGKPVSAATPTTVAAPTPALAPVTTSADWAPQVDVEYAAPEVDAPEPLEASITEGEAKAEPLDASIGDVADIAPLGPEATNSTQAEPLDASIGDVRDIAPIPNTSEAVPDVPSQDDDSQLVDFGGEQPTFQQPTPEEMEQARSQLTSTLQDFISSFFNGAGELNAAPSEQNSEEQVQTETRELPGGGFMIIQRRSSPYGEAVSQSSFESSSSSSSSPSDGSGYGRPMMMDGGDAFELPPPPPAFGGLFSRLFGAGPPPPPRPFLARGMFDLDESPILGGRRRGGCKKHRGGLFARLRSVFDAPPLSPDSPSSSDDFSPLARFPSFMHHDEPENWPQQLSGPFVKANFDLTDASWGNAEANSPSEEDASTYTTESGEEDASSSFGDSDSSSLVEAEEAASNTNEEDAEAAQDLPPTPEQQQAAGEGFVAPHMYERDYRMGGEESEVAQPSEVAPPPPSFEPRPFIDETDEWQPRHHRGGLGRWIHKHKVAFGLIVSAVALLVLAFAVFMLKRRRRKLAEAQNRPSAFVSAPGPLMVESLTADTAQPVQAYSVQMSPPNQNGYRLLQA